MSAMLPTPRDWQEWGHLFQDLQLWRPVVEQLCRQTGTAAARRVESSYPGSCAVFVADRQAVVKIFPPWLHHDFRREVEAYRLLDGRLGPLLPTVLAQGIFQDAIEWPYLILEFRPGQAWRDARPAIPAEQQLALMRELGGVVAAVHATPLADANVFATRPAAWHSATRNRQSASLAALEQGGVLSGPVLEELAALCAAAPAAPAHFRPLLLNADLTEDHLLLVQRDGRWQMSALIDWGDAEAGAADYEWVALWFGLCGREPSLFRELLRAYDPALNLDAAFARRMVAMTCAHLFGAKMIADALRPTAPRPVRRLDELQARLWPL